MARPYLGCGWALIGPGLGFGAEAAVHAMRLIHSGVFDEHPGLRIILGHLGEGLTFWINRLDIDFERPWLRRNPQLRIDRPPSEYLREHFVFTTSTFLASALVAVLTELGSDRIMFASDHPWLSMADAVEFIEGSPLSDVARHDVCHGTAERLLGL
jgi:2,3-dihydroxybenzoate decarboxylase